MTPTVIQGEYENESTIEDSDSTAPPSPSSEMFPLIRSGSSGRHRRRNKTLLQRILLWILWPLRFLVQTFFWWSGNHRSRQLQDIPENHGSNSGNFRNLARHLSGSREFAVPKSLADRRRGIIEDLQLVAELMIERVFEVVRYIVHHVLSPFKTFREFIRWAFFRNTSYNDGTETTDVATLGDSEPAPHKQIQVLQQLLNTDNRTCQDIITSLGYPYEAYRVTTEDGHVLLHSPADRYTCILEEPVTSVDDGGISDFSGRRRIRRE